VGAVLHQKEGSAWRPLAFYSKKLDAAQHKYSAFDRELLAAYLAVRHFCFLLEGGQFSIQTDHKPLNYALGSRLSRGQLGNSASSLTWLNLQQTCSTWQVTRTWWLIRCPDQVLMTYLPLQQWWLQCRIALWGLIMQHWQLLRQPVKTVRA
jgi:hypothetical protein